MSLMYIAYPSDKSQELFRKGTIVCRVLVYLHGNLRPKNELDIIG